MTEFQRVYLAKLLNSRSWESAASTKEWIMPLYRICAHQMRSFYVNGAGFFFDLFLGFFYTIILLPRLPAFGGAVLGSQRPPKMIVCFTFAFFSPLLLQSLRKWKNNVVGSPKSQRLSKLICIKYIVIATNRNIETLIFLFRSVRRTNACTFRNHRSTSFLSAQHPEKWKNIKN